MKHKTLKRELAAAAIAFWAVITVRLFWHLDADAIRALDSAYGMLTTIVWLYAAGAFGMDSFAKQIRAVPGAGP